MTNNMDDLDIEMDDLERIEYEYQKQIKEDILILMNNESFQRAILDGYIEKVALDVGSNFTGSNEDLKALNSITHLKQYLENSVN